MKSTTQKLPRFVKFLCIADLVFCGLYVLFFPMMRLLEGAAGLPVVLTGIPAAILILRKKPTGLKLGIICVVLTGISILMSIVATFQYMPAEMEASQLFLYFTQAVIVLLFRAAFLLLYCFMLFQFKIYLLTTGFLDTLAQNGDQIAAAFRQQMAGAFQQQQAENAGEAIFETAEEEIIDTTEEE